MADTDAVKVTSNGEPEYQPPSTLAYWPGVPAIQKPPWPLTGTGPNGPIREIRYCAARINVHAITRAIWGIPVQIIPDRIGLFKCSEFRNDIYISNAQGTSHVLEVNMRYLVVSSIVAILLAGFATATFAGPRVNTNQPFPPKVNSSRGAATGLDVSGSPMVMMMTLQQMLDADAKNAKKIKMQNGKAQRKSRRATP